MLDLVDQNDYVIKQKSRSEIYDKQLSNFRVVNAFLINEKGKLWIPRRSQNKRIFPRCLDASMGGHVTAGESYDDAFKRELLEELNIDVTKTRYDMVGKLTPHEHQTSAFMQVYLLHVNEAPAYNPNDFIEFFWLTPQETIDYIEAGNKSKDDLPKIIKELQHLF